MSHLTEEQVDELVMGSIEASEAAQMREHAASCEACAAQLAEIEAPIASFKAVTLAWSERRSATLPVRPSQRAGARWGMGFVWGSLAAATLLAAVIPVMRHEQNVRSQQAQNKILVQPTATPNLAPANIDTAAPEVPENPQEIANDNRMLAMVDEELNAPIPSLGSATSGHGNARLNTQGRVQD